jgi:hypothetical protein
MSFRVVFGAVLVTAAVLLNPGLLDRFVVLDGTIQDRDRVVLAELALAAVGFILIVWGRRASARGATSRRTRIFATAAFGLALVLSVGLAELALRTVFDPALVLEGEQWSEYTWRARHGPGGEPVREGSYDYDRYHPLLGWVPVPGYAKDGIHTNALGLRGRREYPFERPPGLRRIVVVGDSYTWGEQTWEGEIRDDETFVALLEKALPCTEAINLGVHGWGTDQQYLYLRELGLRFQPDLVVLGFFEPDSARNVVDFFGYAKPRFVLEQGELVLTNTPVRDGPALLATPFEMPRSFLFSLIRKGWNTVLDRTRLRPIESREEWQITRALFEAARRESEAAGAHFLLMDIPFHVQERPTPIARTTAGWAAESGTRFLALREHFVTLPRSEWGSLHDGHFTARGHAETARALIETIERDRLLPDLGPCGVE